MSSPFPEDSFNPYAPPKTDIGAEVVPGSGDLARDEMIRRLYLSHEASVKALGALNYLGGTIEVVAGLFLLGMGIYRFSNPGAAVPANNPQLTTPFFIGMGILVVVLGVVAFAIGSGVRRLQPWGRWSEVALSAFGLVVNLINLNPVGSLFPVYFLYLMLSKKGAMVFSPEYREVIARTPHIRYKTSWIVKGCGLVLIAVLVIALVGGIIGALFRR